MKLLQKLVKNPLLKNIFIYAFSDGISKAMPFLVFPIIAYYLTKEEFGLVTNYNVVVGIIGPFVGLSTSSFLAVDYFRKDQDIQRIYLNLLYFNILLFFVVALILLFIPFQLEQWSGLNTKWIYIALLSVILTIFTDFHFTRLRMEEKVRLFGLFNISSSVLSAFLTILFVVVLKMGWEGRIYSLFFTCLGISFFTIYYSIRFISKIEKPDFGIMYKALKFGLPLLPHNLSLWIKTGFDKFFITASLGLALNGVYSFAMTICSIFVMFSNAFFAAFSPYVFKTISSIDADADDHHIKLGIVKKSYFFLLAYFVVLIVGWVVGYIVITLFFREKYGQALVFLPFLLGYNFFNSCYIVLSMFIYYSKTTRYLGIITICTSLMQVFFMVVLVSHIGALGAAISSLLVSIITVIVIYLYSNKVYPMPWFRFSEIFKNEIKLIV